MANYVFFVSANPRALILIASTFTGIEISHQIFIVLFGLSRKFWCPGKFVLGTKQQLFLCVKFSIIFVDGSSEYLTHKLISGLEL